MKFKKQVCIIIDAYSTGKYIAPALSGYQCIHIQSSDNLPSDITSSLRQSDFIENIVYRGDISSLLVWLKKYHIKLCIPGSESGVELADTLTEALNLPTNGTQYSSARRNKFLMTQLVAEAGLRTVKHFQSSSLEEIQNWIDELPQEDFPVVLKPVDSASGDNVHFCYNQNKVKTAYDKIISSSNLFGVKNNSVLAQSFNAGQEYIVNSVSYDGNHFIVEIWRVIKKPGTAIYDNCEIVFEDEEEYQALSEYAIKTLDALRIAYGAGTTELKYSPERGPVLIECAARLMGAAELSFSQEIFGYTQLSIMLEAYLNPPAFLKRISDKKEQPTARYYGMAVLLISDASGILQDELTIVRRIKRLPTLFSYDIVAEKGAEIACTQDMLSSPGTIYLLDNDRDSVRHDYQYIRNIEARGIYHEALLPAEKITLQYSSSVSKIDEQRLTALSMKWGLKTRDVASLSTAEYRKLQRLSL